MKVPTTLLGASCAFLLLQVTHARVVINEIFYHAPQDIEGLQWIELYNTSDEAMDLTGWALAREVKARFPEGTRIASKGYLVVCRDAVQFTKYYKEKPGGTFEKSLKRGGGDIELRDPTGKVMDAVKYDDRAPWPASPDGHSASLERIVALDPGNVADNWAASGLTPDGKPGGSPGKPNSVLGVASAPRVSDVQLSPTHLLPGQKLKVTASIEPGGDIKRARLHYRILIPGEESAEKSIEMQAREAGKYFGTIDSPNTQGVMRVWIEAETSQGGTRRVPDANDLRPAWSVALSTNVLPGKISQAYVINPKAKRGRSRGGGEFTAEDQARWMFQTKFRTEADLSALWAGIALTNGLEAGQLAKLRPILAALHAERNELINSVLGVDEVSKQGKAVDLAIRNFRSNAVANLSPHLTAGQRPALDLWKKAPPRNSNQGFNPDDILRMQLDYDVKFFFASAACELTDEQFGRLRQLVLEGVTLRAGLREAAKTAFTTPDSDVREKFQQRLGEIREKMDQKAPTVMGDIDVSPMMSMRDEAAIFRRGGSPSADDGAARGQSAFIVWDVAKDAPEVFDFVSLVERKAGWKVHFAKDQPFRGMTSINLVHEFVPRMVLAEPLAMEVYRAAGNAAPIVEYVRLYMDQQALGYHVLIEQPNKAFLRRNGLRDDGHLYKLGWQGQTLKDVHEKKTRLSDGHADLEKVVKQLSGSQGEAQWAVIKKEFNVPQVLTYFAVNSLLAHWDGYMNNYYAYDDVNGTKKWEIYPWDQDKTMGLHDGIRDDSVFVELPLNYGAAGDLPPGWKGRPPRNFMESMQRSGSIWWRPPGYFSGPLLSNPMCKAQYVARIKNLLDEVFTEKRMNAEIERLNQRLREEVRFHASANGGDPQEALAEFDSNLDSLRKFVTGRRRYLLNQDEIKKAGPWDPKAFN